MRTSSNQRPDILCFSSTDWYGKWGSRQQVMMRLAAQGHRVLFVERLAGLEHFWKYSDLRQRRRQGWQEGIREIEPNLWLLSPPPLLPGRYYFIWIAWLNSAIVQFWLRPYLQRLMFDRLILWLYQPEHAFLVGRFSERLSVYHCIDEFAAGTYGHKRQTIKALEASLLSRVNIVFANSKLTYQNKRNLNPNTYHLPSAADVDHFVQATNCAADIHDDIAGLPRPILAFVGNINEKIDISLLVQIAQARPHWTIVMIGQAHPYATDLEPLQSLANVYWLGKRPFSSLPALLRGVDVCLLPYVQGEATRYRSPLKLYEYLATGKPIVSTSHPEIDEFDGLVTISSTANFIKAIEEVLQTDTLQRRLRRVEVARQHSWDRRVKTINDILTRYWSE